MSGRGGSLISRRVALAGGGALVVHFALGTRGAHAAGSPGSGATGFGGRGGVGRAGSSLPGSLRRWPMLDSWLRVDASGAITVFTGKAELGQGIETALVQIAAEELAVVPASITIVTADTGRTPDEGYTAGSHSMQDSGTAILNAAAQAREILVRLAARRWRLPAEGLRPERGAIVAPNGRRIGYGALVSAQTLHVRAEPHSRLTEPGRHRLIGASMPRLDIPLKLTGESIYVQDLRPPGMVHARVVRPPSYGAQLVSVDLEAARRLPGVMQVVRDGSYLAVVASREHQAIVAMEALAQAARWSERAELPDRTRLYEALASWPSRALDIAGDRAAEGRSPLAPAARMLQAEYRRPYLMHGSIGPSCAVARFESDQLTVWTHSQGVFPLRSALAELLQLPEERVHCIQAQGSGCYGHNGADDAAADAALIARAVPGRAVRVQWMRAEENLWEPYGPAMLARVRGELDSSGRIASWEYELWSNTHSTRPGGAGNLMPAWFLAHPLTPPAPHPIPLPEGGGDRNALPFYRIPRVGARFNFIPQMPLRVSALRSLGAHLNVFAIESFMDELARAAGVDSIEFRLRHLEDARAVYVVRTAAERFGWSRWAPTAGVGRGFAFARYKNLAAYAAIAVEAEVDRDGRARLRRAVAAVDCGMAVNPDGVRNQIEGGILQAASWTLKESVAFDRRRITSRDWASYPILRFEDVPDSIEVVIAERPGEPFLGLGEAAQGPTAAAIANAIADAAGVRIRELPLGQSASQIRAGIVLRTA
ncbi:MAG TPA: molybdopterin cofactor-binding domain-containing protein [Steroidobacteraceae bacterium]